MTYEKLQSYIDQKQHLNHTIGFRIDDRTYTKLNQLAKDHHTTTSNMMRAIVNYFFDELEV